MKLELNIDQLRTKKIFIATPMYGGQCHGSYTKAICDFMCLCTRYGIDAKLFFIFNESLITRARNYCADEFLRSGYDYLMFIDSDIHFEPQDVLVMAHFMMNNPEMDIVCGPYPKKAISWEKIKMAVDKGFADQNPGNLEEFVGDYVFNPTEDIKQFRIDEPVQVKEGGTGFMMITRDAFKKIDQKYPNLSYKPDHVRTANFDGSREIMAYFDAVIDDKFSNILEEVGTYVKENPNATKEDLIAFVNDAKNSVTGKPYSNRYLSEDYMFCQWARKSGAKVWLLPWMRLKHAGSYIFGGSLQALATIGASPTADRTSPKK